MQLIYTPRSHFSRKVRILLAALGLEAELIDAGNVAEAEPAAFGANPLMKVPTLVDEGRAVFDSDHIAAYLVHRHDAGKTMDRRAADSDDVVQRLSEKFIELAFAVRHRSHAELAFATALCVDAKHRQLVLFDLRPQGAG